MLGRQSIFGSVGDDGVGVEGGGGGGAPFGGAGAATGNAAAATDIACGVALIQGS